MKTHRFRFFRSILISLCALVVAVLAVCASSATAAESVCSSCSAWWHLSLGARPSVLPREGKAQLVVVISNLGDATVSGAESPIRIADELPEGVEKIAAPTALAGKSGSDGVVKCSEGGPSTPPSCTYEGELPPGDEIEMRLNVNIEGARSGALNKVTVTGGGIAPRSIARPLMIGSSPTPFGVQEFEMLPEEPGGGIDTQAGSHPFQFTTTIELNQSSGAVNHKTELFEAEPSALAKDLNFKLPAGFIGNPTVFPRCPIALFTVAKCSAKTAMGIATVTIDEPRAAGLFSITVPVFNLEPSVGEPARFGFLPTQETPVYLDTSVRTGEDYGVTVSVDNIVQVAGFLASEVTFWGVPGDPRHDAQRGYACLAAARNEKGACENADESSPPPFLSMPTSCEKPFAASVTGNSWEEPESVAKLAEYTLPIAIDGCNRLPFAPEVRVTPDGTDGSSPTGLGVDVHVPQDSALLSGGLAASAVRDIRVILPEGVALNPASGDGLQACSESQIGYEPAASKPPGELRFTPALSEPFCPNAAKVGTVTVHTPLLPNPLTGAVYLASQNENPFGSLVAMYIVAEDPVSGTLIKLPGEVTLDQGTGQITGTFENNPELAFEDAELHFFGEERAPLATPAHCGAYTTSATFTPWSGNAPVSSSSTFEVTSGPKTPSQPGGTSCPGPSLPFSPSLTGGPTNINAGAFSALTTTIGREDGQQNMRQVTLKFPSGLSGQLSSVTLCGEEQANAGTCPDASLIGETTVSAGVGSDPVTVRGGKVFITGPYHGAPFGLSIVNPVKAGPFDLEHDTANPSQDPACDCIVVRAKIEVDPSTAALTVTTNGAGEGYAIPSMIDGIPVQIKKVNVLIDRDHFTFNPTSCNPTRIEGSIAGGEGGSAPVSVPFQIANCQTLSFTPKFTVATSAKSSKALGESLTAKVTEPSDSLGSQANIARVKVELPKQLPSRLTTLQRACTSAQFAANPAGCPSESKIGYATVHTPLLPVPLSGPAIFVSHGGEAFPSLTIVLQGDNVTIDLVGSTFISKAGVTSTTFKTVPDAPFNTFELNLPEGPYSALTAIGNVCATNLVMPTELIAQNGASIYENTKIEAVGCPAAIRVVKQRIKGATVILSVSVPGAGMLVASSPGRSKVARKAVAKAGIVTLGLKLSKGRRHGKVKVKLVFTPKHGVAITSTANIESR